MAVDSSHELLLATTRGVNFWTVDIPNINTYLDLDSLQALVVVVGHRVRRYPESDLWGYGGQGS